jgi:hypothetical protein
MRAEAAGEAEQKQLAISSERLKLQNVQSLLLAGSEVKMEIHVRALYNPAAPAPLDC